MIDLGGLSLATIVPFIDNPCKLSLKFIISFVFYVMSFVFALWTYSWVSTGVVPLFVSAFAIATALAQFTFGNGAKILRFLHPHLE